VDYELAALLLQLANLRNPFHVGWKPVIGNAREVKGNPKANDRQRKAN
jgi:hypothetical protein